jgi:hypothetical protein
MVRSFGYAAVVGLLYVTVKYAVRDGIRLARDDARPVSKDRA